MIVFVITVDMLDLNRNPARPWVLLVPAALTASFTELRDQVPTNEAITRVGFVSAGFQFGRALLKIIVLLTR